MRKSLFIEIILLFLYFPLSVASFGFQKSKSTTSVIKENLLSNQNLRLGSSLKTNSKTMGIPNLTRKKSGANKKLENNVNNIVFHDPKNDPRFPILHSLKYSATYAFDECLQDLEKLLKELYGEVLKNNDDPNLANINNKFKNNKIIRKSGGSVNNFISFEFNLEAFTNQAIEVCSPAYYKNMIGRLQTELKSGSYPEICYMTICAPDTETCEEINNNNDANCFDILIKVDQQIKNKHLLKEKLLGKPISDSTSQINVQNYQKLSAETLTGSPFYFSPRENGKKSKPKSTKVKKSKYQISTSVLSTTVITTTTVPTTVSKTLFKISNKSKTINNIVTRTVVSKETNTITTTYLKTHVSGYTTFIENVKPVTALIVEVSVSTKTIAKKTIVKSHTITKTKTANITNHSSQLKNAKDANENLVGAQYIPGPRSETITSMITTVQRIPLYSRLCNAITVFGLNCADNDETTSSPSAEVTVTTTSTTSTTTSTSTDVKTTTKQTTTRTTTTISKIKTITKTKTVKSKTTETECDDPPSPPDCDDDDDDDPPPPPPPDCDDGDDDDPPPPPPPDCDDGESDDDYNGDDDDFFDDELFYLAKGKKRINQKVAVNMYNSKGGITTRYKDSYNNSVTLSHSSDNVWNKNNSFHQYGNYSKYENEGSFHQQVLPLFFTNFCVFIVMSFITFF